MSWCSILLKEKKNTSDQQLYDFKEKVHWGELKLNLKNESGDKNQ